MPCIYAHDWLINDAIGEVLLAGPAAGMRPPRGVKARPDQGKREAASHAQLWDPEIGTTPEKSMSRKEKNSFITKSKDRFKGLLFGEYCTSSVVAEGIRRSSRRPAFSSSRRETGKETIPGCFVLCSRDWHRECESTCARQQCMP